MSLVPIPWQPHLLTHPDMLAKLTLANSYRGRPILMGSTRAPNGRYLAAWRSYDDGVYLWKGWKAGLPGFSSASDPDSGPRSHQRGVGDDLAEWGTLTIAALKRAGIQVNGVPGEPWHIQLANFLNYPIITSYTSPAGGGATPIGADMPLDANDQRFLNGLGESIIQQITGSAPSIYGDKPLTINQLRRDLGSIRGGDGTLSLAAVDEHVRSAGSGEAPAIDLDALAAKIAPLVKAPTIDYAALAKAVNDDAAQRLAN